MDKGMITIVKEVVRDPHAVDLHDEPRRAMPYVNPYAQ
jgi:hypothetical protein